MGRQQRSKPRRKIQVFISCSADGEQGQVTPVLWSRQSVVCQHLSGQDEGAGDPRAPHKKPKHERQKAVRRFIV